MRQTTNYQLPQWEAGDAVKREDFNGAMSAIDTALAAVAGDGKPLRIANGTYRGDGKYGTSNRNKLTFDFKPMLLVISSFMQFNEECGGYPWIFQSEYGQTRQGACIVIWRDNTVTWYAESAEAQLNLNRSYMYVAIGYED